MRRSARTPLKLRDLLGLESNSPAGERPGRWRFRGNAVRIGVFGFACYSAKEARQLAAFQKLGLKPDGKIGGPMG